jgi:hypothetical protein
MILGDRRWEASLGSQIHSGTCAIGSSGPIRPLLEPAASSIAVEPDYPEVSILPIHRLAIADLCSHDSCVILDDDDIRRQREDLVGTLALGLPHMRDGGQSNDWGLIGGLEVCGVGGEER